jgi:hypothetical protein
VSRESQRRVGINESDFVSCIAFVPCTFLSRSGSGLWVGRVKVKDPLSVPTRVGVIIIAEWRGAAPTSGLIDEQNIYKPKPKTTS